MEPEPLTRRRRPLVRNWREPAESTGMELELELLAVQTMGAPPE